MLYYGKIGISDGINNKRIRRKRVLTKRALFVTGGVFRPRV